MAMRICILYDRNRYYNHICTKRYCICEKLEERLVRLAPRILASNKLTGSRFGLDTEGLRPRQMTKEKDKEFSIDRPKKIIFICIHQLYF